MTDRTIRITRSDMTKLEKLINARGMSTGRDLAHLESLSAELELADVVEDTEMPADVITMHSRVLVQDLKTGENSIYILVFPSEANLSLNKISVLAPIGTALLGYRTGDVIDWNMPGGARRLFIRDVLYQPETSGEAVQRAASNVPGSAIGSALQAAS